MFRIERSSQEPQDNPRRAWRSVNRKAQLALETLEPRTMLAATGATFADLAGTFARPGKSNLLPFTISPSDFHLPSHNVELNLTIESDAGQKIDLSRLRIASKKGPKSAILSKTYASVNKASSLIIGKFAPGAYSLMVSSLGSSAGTYHVHVSMTGDVNGDHGVTPADLAKIQKLQGRTLHDRSYSAAADVDHNGKINARDLGLASKNRGASTRITRLAATVALDAASDPQGDGVVTRAEVGVSGKTTAGATVQFDRNGDGVFDQRTTSNRLGNFHFETSLKLGSTRLHVRMNDRFGQRYSSDLLVTYLDTQPPRVSVIAPVPGMALNTNPIYRGTVADDASGIYLVEAQVDTGTYSPVTVDPHGSFTFATAFPLDGTADAVHTVRFRATDKAGNISQPAAYSFTLDTRPPIVSVTSPAAGATLTSAVTVTGLASDSLSGVGDVQAQLDGGPFVTVSLASDGTVTFPTGLAVDRSANGVHTVGLRAIDSAGNTSAVAEVTFQLNIFATPLDPTVNTTLLDAGAFLYTGINPIQSRTDGQPIVIDPQRAAVIRGQVRDRAGNRVAGVKISVLNHDELGTSSTRDDGVFDMAVNGGGSMVVRYDKPGYLSVERQADVTWQDYTWMDDVVLTVRDPNVSPIDPGAAVAIQVARGGEISDGRGTRQAALFYPQGTQATMVMPDGTTAPLNHLNVHITEYTQGLEGPAAMPAPLPSNVAYTYAVVFHADEALAAGAKDVVFSQPLPFYMENFLQFPVGTGVPLGSYDPDRAQWIASDNGVVLQILDLKNGMAELDIDGTGSAATSTALAQLGISDAERRELAELYTPGQSLWRVLIPHFDKAWDANQGTGGPNDATPPKVPPPTPPADPTQDCHKGSVIGIQNQTLGESVAVTGTSFNLTYRSDRSLGSTAGRSLLIPLSGASLPASLVAIDLIVQVAGQSLSKRFGPTPNQTFAYTWNGLDGQDRAVTGSAPVTVKIGYVYPLIYRSTQRFGYNGGGAISVGFGVLNIASEFKMWQTWHSQLQAFQNSADALGGWSLDVHQSYDPVGSNLLLGNGEVVNSQSLNLNVISAVAGIPTLYGGYSGDGGLATSANLRYPNAVAVASDGSVYIADSGNNRIRRVGIDGIITTIAGTGTAGSGGDGGPATSAQLCNPFAIALGPDGSLYIADSANDRVRKVGPDGIISTITVILLPSSIAVSPDGSIFVGCDNSFVVRRIGPDRTISTIAGRTISGNPRGFSGDGGPAVLAQLNDVTGLAVGPDGSLYLADSANNRIRRIGPDGIITTVAGNGVRGFTGDGDFAANASLNWPSAVAVASDGTLYITDSGNHRIRIVDTQGIIRTLAGNGTGGSGGDGGPAAQAQLLEMHQNQNGIAVGPNGNLFIADKWYQVIRRVSTTMPSVSVGETAIPSPDGNQVYVFNSAGKHLVTRDAFTGHTLYQFGYDAAGRLLSVSDQYSNVTHIERDAQGNPTAIVAPFGQRTTLKLDSSGHLATISNPASETVRLRTTGSGLLQQMIDPGAGEHDFEYDPQGRLSSDQGPDGEFTRLERKDNPLDGRDNPFDFTVIVTTAAEPQSTYRVERRPDGSERRTNINYCACGDPTGTTVTIIGTDGSQTTTGPDGTVSVLVLGPDPRFGMQAPLTKSLTVTTPAGLKSTLTTTRTASLRDPENPLSLLALTDSVTVDGRTSSTIYDAKTQSITSTSPEGRTTVATLDALGNIASESTPGVTAIQYAYDTHGRLATVTQDTRTSTFAYDTQGNLASVTDPEGHVASFVYDAAGRVVSQKLPGDRMVGFTYDADGNVTGVTPPGQPTHTFTYSPGDRVTSYNPPDVSAGNDQTGYSYDKAGRLSIVQRPDGTTVSYAYDRFGRLATITDSSSGTRTLTYDEASGNLTSISAPDGANLAYSFDGSLLKSIDRKGVLPGSVGYSYDSSFRVTSQSVDGVSIGFTYDKDDLLKTAGALTLIHDASNGRLTGTTLGTVSDAYSYSLLGEFQSYTAKVGGVATFATQYTRDNLGRITKLIETIDGTTRTLEYAYDDAGRLAQVKQDGLVTEAYTYDANGNRLSATTPSGTVKGTYDAQDRLLTYGTNTYTYTANGELLTKTDSDTGEKTGYTYDAFGNLTTVILPDKTRIDYLVDGENRRIGKKVNGVLVQGFLYDEAHITPVAELDGQGNVVARFVYGTSDHVPDYMIKDGVTYRLITDQLGSVRLVVNTATGTVAQRMDYDAFGKVTRDSNAEFQPFGFAGGLYDRDTDLLRFGERDYDTETGRWMSKDPLLFDGGTPGVYTYSMGDPVNRIDPNGMVDSKIKPYLDDLIQKSTIAKELFDNVNGQSRVPVTIKFGTNLKKGCKRAYGLTNAKLDKDKHLTSLVILIDINRTLRHSGDPRVVLGHELSHASRFLRDLLLGHDEFLAYIDSGLIQHQLTDADSRASNQSDRSP